MDRSERIEVERRAYAHWCERWLVRTGGIGTDRDYALWLARTIIPLRNGYGIVDGGALHRELSPSQTHQLLVLLDRSWLEHGPGITGWRLATYATARYVLTIWDRRNPSTGN